MNKLTTEQFIVKAKKVHGENTYGYGNVVYVNTITPVIINCHIHGPFEQKPNQHLSGAGCKPCGIIARSNICRSSAEQFIIKAKKVHGDDTYGYGNVVYVNTITPVIIDCHIHGPFTQTPGGHLSGRGCKPCGIIARKLKRTLTTEEFIIKAKKVHGDDTYGYGNVVYVNSITPVIIDCHIHGPFKQVPASHLVGTGCPKCWEDARRLTTEEFIIKAKEKHGLIYDYSDVVYIHSRIEVTIICPVHGPFTQTPGSHLSGRGCPQCACGNDIKSFKIKAILKHGLTYGYGNVVYVNTITPVIIDCHIHGPFEQTPNNHLQGRGCPKCRNEELRLKFSSNTEEFIIKAKKVHGENTYGYGNIVYINNRTPVIIDCHIHGSFEQTPSKHLAGQGCKWCGIIQTQKQNTKTTEQFIIEAKEKHGDVYDYSKVVYVTAHTKVTIGCHIHGPFEQNPNSHLRGRGCPKCSKGGQSAMAIAWLEEEMKKEGIFIQHAMNLGEFKIPGTNYEADGYCAETNTIYEFHGNYWHGNPKYYLSEDINPSSNQTYGELYAATIAREAHIRSLGYNLVVLWEDDIKNV